MYSVASAAATANDVIYLNRTAFSSLRCSRQSAYEMTNKKWPFSAKPGDKNGNVLKTGIEEEEQEEQEQPKIYTKNQKPEKIYC